MACPHLHTRAAPCTQHAAPPRPPPPRPPPPQVLPWLDGLLGDPRGRKLIYELSSQHRNSLLLNFAIQRIMKNVRGEQGEGRRGGG